MWRELAWRALIGPGRHPLAGLAGLAALITVIALTAWATLALRRALAARRLARRAARGRAGERAAERLLRALGYRVLATQAVRRLWVEVDGERREYTVVADLVVVDGEGRRLVAEVKTGARAPDPLHPPTRRQLLEYALGYREAEGVLLVDIERRRVRRIRFGG